MKVTQVRTSHLWVGISLGSPSQDFILNTPQDGAFQPHLATSPLTSLHYSRPLSTSTEHRWLARYTRAYAVGPDRDVNAVLVVEKRRIFKGPTCFHVHDGMVLRSPSIPDHYCGSLLNTPRSRARHQIQHGNHIEANTHYLPSAGHIQ